MILESMKQMAIELIDEAVTAVFVNEVVRSIMQPDAQIRSRLVAVDLG